MMPATIGGQRRPQRFPSPIAWVADTRLAAVPDEGSVLGEFKG
jgi:hypothetical protein